jgi:hypothetical protein
VHDPITVLLFLSSARDVLTKIVVGKGIYQNGCVRTVDKGGLRASTLTHYYNQRSITYDEKNNRSDQETR